MPTFDTPLVSIAMCTYNGERFLREQLDSLIAQDYPNLEIVIVDDCSTDSTFEILRQYEAEHPHIRLFQNDQNIGFKQNFEKAMSLCTGEFIALCDQGDVWFPHKISTLAKQIGQNSLIYSQVQLIDGNEHKLEKAFPNMNLLERRCPLGLLFRNCMTACIFKRNMLEKALLIPKDFIFHDHWIAFVASTLYGLKIHYEFLSLYRQHSGNAVLSSHKKRKPPNKLSYRKSKFQTRLVFLRSAADYEGFLEEERELATAVHTAYNRYPHLLYQPFFEEAAETHRTTLPVVYRDPEKSMRKLCRGFIQDLF
jgi:glycosyltransferase involved in cell wall biosynthesis